MSEPAVSDAALRRLDEQFGSRCRVDDDTRAVWGRDWTRVHTPAPSAVVFPESAEEVHTLVQLALDEKCPLVPSGGRTGLAGGAVAAGGEVVVSFDRMNRILDFEPADRLVRCEPGVVTATLQNFAAERDLLYPVDFASAGSSQVGGNIATNAGGTRVLRYGMTRERVASLSVVTGSGLSLQCGRGLHKDNAGYDLKNLFIGSEGTLGLVTEAWLWLTEPMPPLHSAWLVLADEAALPELLPVLRRLPLYACEFIDAAVRGVLAQSGHDTPGGEACPAVLLDFPASAQPVLEETLSPLLASGQLVDVALAPDEWHRRTLWQAREAITECLDPLRPVKLDLAFRPGRLPDFLTRVRAALTDQPFEVCAFGHLLDGNVHLNVVPHDTRESALAALMVLLVQEVMRHEGSVSAEHGIGLLKTSLLQATVNEAQWQAMHLLKSVFDPAGILNPGKVLLQSGV